MTISKSKLIWICPKCGTEFEDLDDETFDKYESQDQCDTCEQKRQEINGKNQTKKRGRPKRKSNGNICTGCNNIEICKYYEGMKSIEILEEYLHLLKCKYKENEK